MGFGYLFLGYLVTFLLYMTVSGLGLGGVALLLGYSLMLYGLWQLNHYHRAFAWSKWILLPLLLLALFDTLRELDALLLWRLPLFGETLVTVLDWCKLLLLIFFNLAMLYAIRMLAGEVGLLHIATAAVRNSVFVALYALLSVLARMPFVASIQGYFNLPLVLLDLVWIICNLLLLISCTKNICPAGDEEVAERRSRFAFVNRIQDIYEENKQKNVERATRETEDFLRKRREKRENQTNKKKKKR